MKLWKVYRLLVKPFGDYFFLKSLNRALSAGVTVVDIARELDVSKPTVTRWSQGLSCPHPAMHLVAMKSFRKLRRAAKRDKS